MSSKSGTGSKQQTSLFSFFGGGGGNATAGSKKSESTGTSASSSSSASSKKRAKTKANASKMGSTSNAKGGGKKIDTAGGSSKNHNKTKTKAARASAPPLATNSTKKRRIAIINGAADTSTTTPRKPSKVIENVPDFSTFSYAQNESAAAAADDTPMSAATTRTAASTPSSSPLPSSATTPSDAANANADADVQMKAVEKEDVTNNADDTELPSTEKEVIGTLMEDAQAMSHDVENDATSNANADNDNDDDDDGESETKNDKSNSDDDEDNDSSSDSDTESAAAQGEYQLSEYELLRLRNIERNNRRLAELGLAGGWSSAMPSNTNELRQKAEKKSRKKVKGDTTKTRTPAMPTRRSTRARRTVLEVSAEGEGTFGASILLADNNVPTYQEKAEIEEEPVEEVFTVSPMLEYAMNADNNANTDASAALEEWPTDAQPSIIQCLEPIGKRLAPPNGLGAIYSLQFYPREWCPELRSENQSWIVGAGKAGIISLWDCNWSSGSSASAVEEDDMIDPVLSWKAHSGRWVADVRFLPSTSGSEGVITKSQPSRLLSAANDGSVCLWDLSTVSSLNGSPKLLCRTGKELHRSGIFAMDVDFGQHQTYVATGSKDKTVAVVTLDAIARGSGFVEPIWVSDYHTAKVGAVAFCGKGTSLLASASDDGTIAVHDFRANGKKQVVAELVDAHYRPHSVSWDPLSANNLMTAGLDDQVKVFDIRSLDKPLYTYQGHVPTLSKYKRIHHPVFYNPCQRTASSELFVLSGGESSAALSMFRNQDAKEAAVSVYSRGRLPADCGDAGCLAIQGQRVASTVDGGEVLLLAPKLNKG